MSTNGKSSPLWKWFVPVFIIGLICSGIFYFHWPKEILLLLIAMLILSFIALFFRDRKSLIFGFVVALVASIVFGYFNWNKIKILATKKMPETENKPEAKEKDRVSQGVEEPSKLQAGATTLFTERDKNDTSEVALVRREKEMGLWYDAINNIYLKVHTDELEEVLVLLRDQSSVCVKDKDEKIIDTRDSRKLLNIYPCYRGEKREWMKSVVAFYNTTDTSISIQTDGLSEIPRGLVLLYQGKHARNMLLDRSHWKSEDEELVSVYDFMSEIIDSLGSEKLLSDLSREIEREQRFKLKDTVIVVDKIRSWPLREYERKFLIAIGDKNPSEKDYGAIGSQMVYYSIVHYLSMHVSDERKMMRYKAQCIRLINKASS